MLPFPDIDPVLLKIGPLQIRWYGLMYAFGFIGSYFLIAAQEKARRLGLYGARLQDLLFFIILGLILGARFGYVLFYQYPNLSYYLERPIEFIAVWHGGMSFHGGLAGAIFAGLLFCKLRGLPAWEIADRVIVTAPVGLFLGRIGNFINGEIYGRPTSLPWGMVFPGAGTTVRHPSQLYEAGLEGVVLFWVLWRLRDTPLRPGVLVSLFLSGYGALRFVAEFFREPDPQIGLFFGTFSMGQVLCFAMILSGLFVWRILPAPVRTESPKKKRLRGTGVQNSRKRSQPGRSNTGR